MDGCFLIVASYKVETVIIKSYNKTPLGETGYLSNFLGYFSMPLALHSAFQTCEGLHQLCSELYPNYVRFPTFLNCPGIQFFDSLLSLLSQLAYGYHLSLCSNCVTYGMLCHSIGHQMLVNQPLPRETEDSPKEDKHPKHVPLFTYLVWFQPIIINFRLVFKHVKTKNAVLEVKSLAKFQ